MMERKEILKKNLDAIKERISAATEKAGRDSDSVKLVGVTKYVDAETARDLVDAGCDAVGESRPQLFRDKREKMSDLYVEWHLIGHLQRNKIKFVLPHATLIHSVDSIRLMESLEEAAGKAEVSVNILLQVNISGEDAKDGFAESDLQPVLERASSSKSLRVHGFMGMSRWGGTTDDANREFESLRRLRDRLAEQDFGERVSLDELSMGMTGDFEAAIAQGSTIVRIGSALFEGI